jgi:hypothetical protein
MMEALLNERALIALPEYSGCAGIERKFEVNRIKLRSSFFGNGCDAHAPTILAMFKPFMRQDFYCVPVIVTLQPKVVRLPVSEATVNVNVA